MIYSRDTMDNAILGDGFRNIESPNETPTVTIVGDLHVWRSGGMEVWMKDNGERHRDDGPAVTLETGVREWWSNNHRYRVDYPNGDKKWYREGILHREDGPAVEYESGRKDWYFNGLEHREDGPAILYPDGTEVWSKNGEKHRVDGPAWISPTGHEEWFIEGKRHREDGPAYISSRGDERWYYKGNLHRLDGPASETASGVSSWFIHGRKHRTDGPAIEFDDGSYQWVMDNEYVDKKKVINHAVQCDLKTLLMEKAVHHGLEALIGKYLP